MLAFPGWTTRGRSLRLRLVSVLSPRLRLVSDSRIRGALWLCCQPPRAVGNECGLVVLEAPAVAGPLCVGRASFVASGEGDHRLGWPSCAACSFNSHIPPIDIEAISIVAFGMPRRILWAY